MSQSKIKCIYFSHIFPRHGMKSEKRIAKSSYAICAGRACIHQARHYERSHFELGAVYLLLLFTPDMQYSSDMLFCSSTSPPWYLLLDFKSSKREESSINHIHVKIPMLLHLNRVLKIFPHKWNGSFSWAESVRCDILDNDAIGRRSCILQKEIHNVYPIRKAVVSVGLWSIEWQPLKLLLFQQNKPTAYPLSLWCLDFTNTYRKLYFLYSVRPLHSLFRRCAVL